MPSSPFSETKLLATRDAVAASLRRIEMLAGLLEEVTARQPREPVESALVGETAAEIAEEAARMRAVLLEQGNAQTRMPRK